MNESMIKTMQENLLTIRQIFGWTAEEFGSKIGVSKQTICNIENKKSKLSASQYIAIRTILSEEIESRKDEEKIYLSNAVSVLLDENENLTAKQKETAKNEAKVIAAATAGGATWAVISSMLETATIGTSALSAGIIGVGIAGVAALPVVGGIVGALIGTKVWLPKLSSKNNEQKNNNNSTK